MRHAYTWRAVVAIAVLFVAAAVLFALAALQR